jgi:hypothetical protein
MSTSQFAYPHFLLQCPNHHYIPVPHPNLLEINEGPQQTATENRKAVFVCPECGLASAYSTQDMVRHLSVGTPGLFQAGECHLVSLEIECDGENCGAQKLIHAIQGDKKGTWTPRVAQKDWTFSDSALCGAGHRLRYDVSEPHQVTPTEMPF